MWGIAGLDGLCDLGELETTPSNIRVTRDENDVNRGVFTFLITDGGKSLAFLREPFIKSKGDRKFLTTHYLASTHGFSRYLSRYQYEVVSQSDCTHAMGSDGLKML